jgi:hypothetical protein
VYGRFGKNSERRGHGMRVMSTSPDDAHHAPNKLRPTLEEVKALLAEERDFLRPIVEAVLQELLEAEMTETLCAAKGRTDAGAARPPQRSLRLHPGHQGRQAGAAGAMISAHGRPRGKRAGRRLRVPPSCLISMPGRSAAPVRRCSGRDRAAECGALSDPQRVWRDAPHGLIMAIQPPMLISCATAWASAATGR